jgi:DNA mismatch endonuclease, patch repair protein
MDKIAKEKRSYIMSRIRSRNTKPEMVLRKALYALGYRYRLHTNLPGKPDILLTNKKVAIFVHGCFWHHHTCKSGHMPKSNQSYWLPKINKNVERHGMAVQALGSLGWNTLTVWECSIKSSLGDVTQGIEEAIKK